ncbi:glycosyltransferase involved in cell wall biosynthesis [Natronocella acetinitrilica]|uniref:Glycosyltransferase involved in cell wall biosynthesis n=1 Tax=Natronocella acetinitrilica TaxID=414046 RepID=A0AAE3G6R4_9GAMM|nr:glycosyltransferase [Natronocella acetinitrilica]MCP1675791.1 glycosyltransferase involved in cell wall biosynthesis [Natronocella acetinitrilica]
MKILVLAPHPFYQERGTPIAVDLLIRALSERGDQIDVLTFHEGADRTYPGVSIHRIRQPLGRLQGVRPGPSFKKLICDVYLFTALIAHLRRQRYDLIHAVEESAFMAMLMRPFFATPYLYDMDSSMATQIVNRYPVLRPLQGLFRTVEKLPVRYAEAVVPVCDALAEELPRNRVRYLTVLKDISLLGLEPVDLPPENLREQLGIAGSISLYIGNLEPYQGIDLLLASFGVVHPEDTGAHLVIIGGERDEIERYESLARRLCIDDRTHFLGKRPLGSMGAYLSQADILLSPRIEGVNTPMKIYSYLHTGVAVLATRLPTHTQVMTSALAMLAEATPSGFAESWLHLLKDRALRQKLGHEASLFIEREHSYKQFRKTLFELYAHLDHTLPATPTASEETR